MFVIYFKYGTKKINMEQAWNNYKEGEENEAVNEIRRTERRTGDG